MLKNDEVVKELDRILKERVSSANQRSTDERLRADSASAQLREKEMDRQQKAADLAAQEAVVAQNQQKVQLTEATESEAASDKQKKDLTHQTAQMTAIDKLEGAAAGVDAIAAKLKQNVDTAVEQQAAAKAKKDAADAARSDANNTLKIKNDELSAAEKLIGDVSKTIGELENKVRGLEDIKSSAENTLRNLGGALSAALKGKRKDAEKKLNEAKDSLNEALGKLNDERKKLLDVEGIKKAALEARDKASEAVNDASERARKASRELANRVDDVDLAKSLSELRTRGIKELAKVPDDLIQMIEDVGSEAERALVNVAHELKAAAEEVKKAETVLVKAKDEVVKAKDSLENSKLVQDAKKELVSARDQVVKEAERAADYTKERVEVAAKSVKEAVEMLTNTEVIPYDIGSTLTFSFNGYTSGFYANMEFDFAGTSWDSEKTKDLIKGSVALPSVSPAQLAATALGLSGKINGEKFFTIRNKTLSPEPSGGDHPVTDRRTYYASRRFVDWASGDKVVELAAKSIVDGGQSAIAEIRQQFLLEFQNIQAWFQLTGNELSDEMAVELVFGILQGKAVELPGVKLSFQNVQYEFEQGTPVGASFLPGPLRDRVVSLYSGAVSKVKREFEKKGLRMAVPHASFVIELTNLPTTSYDQSIDNVFKLRGKGREASLKAATLVFSKIAERIDDKNLQRIVKELVKALQQGQIDEGALVQKFVEKLGLSKDELEKVYVPGRRILDLSSLPVADRLDEFFKICSLGNKGAAKVTRLELDLVTLELSGTVDLRHCHSWGKLKDILSKL